MTFAVFDPSPFTEWYKLVFLHISFVTSILVITVDSFVKGTYATERSAGNTTRVRHALSDNTDLAVDGLHLDRVEPKQSLASRT